MAIVWDTYRGTDRGWTVEIERLATDNGKSGWAWAVYRDGGVYSKGTWVFSVDNDAEQQKALTEAIEDAIGAIDDLEVERIREERRKNLIEEKADYEQDQRKDRKLWEDLGL